MREVFGIWASRDSPALYVGIVCFRWTPHPVIVTIMDNKDNIRVLLYSYYTTITGWGVLLMYVVHAASV